MPSHILPAKALRPFRDIGKSLRNGFLLILSIVLILLAVFLITLLVQNTFAPYFNCSYLIDRSLHSDSLCKGMWPLPALNAIDPPLGAFRQFIAWNIILFFALVSLILGLIASKIIGFVRLLLTPEGRKVVLTNLSVSLLFFVIFCTLFYLRVVR